MQAALTGHLVLSTLHTNDAPATVSRLLDMGVDDYLLTSTRCRRAGAASGAYAAPAVANRTRSTKRRQRTSALHRVTPEPRPVVYKAVGLRAVQPHRFHQARLYRRNDAADRADPPPR